MRSVYVGRGEIARLDAALHAMQQEDRQAERMKERQLLEAVNPLDADIDALARLVSTLIDATLISAGFHQHRRQWRKLKA